MKGFRRTLLVRGSLALVALGVAHAHFALVQPPSALAIEDGGKGAPPCAEGPASNVVTQVQGGHPIAIRLTEFVAHPGHYRFALSVNSRAELPPDPDVVQDSNGLSVSASIQNPVRIPVLADGVFVHDAPPTADWQTSLTLPNLNCDKCTLQIIEFMAEHGFNVGGGFFYHHCADFRIVADTSLPAADPAWPRAVQQSRAAFSHIAAGGGWTTAITLINTSPAPVPVTVAFHGDDGSAWSLPATVTQQGVTQTSAAASVNAVINPNATLLISMGDPIVGDPITGDQSSPVVGWADVQSSGPVGGYVIFRSTPGAGSPSEGTAPLQTQAPSTITLPYDNAGGFVMGVALANLSSSSANITVTIWDDSGNQLGTKTLTIGGSGHTAFVLPDQLTPTAGRRGIVRFQSGAAGGIAALGLRFSPFGTFTSVPAM
ncbi:MAG TPA: SCE4755 family polysaccharide monooxygenase-like protein [Candidatus Acidoferrales bacterium]|jgi:hypothetical protein|nr:SCE4755 family polysaccharide monooxygenase-like protein [Candidatus Acidoferrales bacterium]